MSEQSTMPPEFFAELTWFKTGDALYPYANTDDEDQDFKIRINDFPEEPLYTLIKDSKVLCSFNDWPQQWIIEDK
ncbi:hypothetical protein [Legionella shakespearei]|uniref:Uncharacterized protein n=1 Tax=Legionella shakespearei DSM 23087 TaxID=1122169 RepID=A0A0W0YQV2_9GAMM|nr:hypothetical protein [Legionella shakespearei]KTD59266.1 hypothetical protein Lsha_1962 [Legionella shakespearei DSM 23087]